MKWCGRIWIQPTTKGNVYVGLLLCIMSYRTRRGVKRTMKEMEETGLWREAIDTFIGQLYFYIITAHIGEIKRKRPPSSILGTTSDCLKNSIVDEDVIYGEGYGMYVGVLVECRHCYVASGLSSMNAHEICTW